MLYMFEFPSIFKFREIINFCNRQVQAHSFENVAFEM